MFYYKNEKLNFHIPLHFKHIWCWYNEYDWKKDTLKLYETKPDPVGGGALVVVGGGGGGWKMHPSTSPETARTGRMMPRMFLIWSMVIYDWIFELWK